MNPYIGAQVGASIANMTVGSVTSFLGDIIGTILSPIAAVILEFMSWLTMLGGVFLNKAVSFTILNMSQHLPGDAIQSTWGVLRDIANMSFIFILLYTSILLIIGKKSVNDARNLIVKMVIAALLINFSMFFTKIVIDASNLIALFLYGVVAPGALDPGASATAFGISNSITKVLNLTSIWKAVTVLNGKQVLVIGIFGSILLLVAAFIFFAMAVMLIIRYVILIFVIIFSPIAFVSDIIPGAKNHFDKWRDALINNAFFPAIFFLVMWVALTLLNGLQTNTSGIASAIGTIGPDGSRTFEPGSVDSIINYVVVIAFMVAAIMISKGVASKTAYGVGKAFGWATSKSGDLFYGRMVGGTLRNSLGKGGAAIASNAELQRAARDEVGFKGARARLALYAGKKMASGSFDPRNASVPTNAVGDLIQGTAGRTKIGKTLGLDEVKFNSIAVGKPASSTAGLGTAEEKGYLELSGDKKKRLREEEKKKAEDLRKAEAKADIEKGMDAPAGSPEERKMITRIQNMSNTEIVNQKFNVLSKPNVALALNAQQLEAIQKHDGFTEAEKEQVIEHHFDKVNLALGDLTSGTSSATGIALTPDEKREYQDMIKNISEKEIDLIPKSMFDPSNPAILDPLNPAGQKDRTFIATVSQSQVDTLTKSNKLIAQEKQNIKNERARPLKDAFASSDWVAAVTAMDRSGADNIAKMALFDAANPSAPSLNNDNILHLYSPALLTKLATKNEFTGAKASALRERIEKVVNRDPAMQTALHNLQATPPPSPAQRNTILSGLPGDRERSLVKAAEWLDSPVGQQTIG